MNLFLLTTDQIQFTCQKIKLFGISTHIQEYHVLKTLIGIKKHQKLCPQKQVVVLNMLNKSTRPCTPLQKFRRNCKERTFNLLCSLFSKVVTCKEVFLSKDKMIGCFINLKFALPCLWHIPYPGIAGIDVKLKKILKHQNYLKRRQCLTLQLSSFHICTLLNN